MKNASSISAADAHFTPGRFAIFLAFLIFANFPEVILGSHTFFVRDYLTVVFPYAQYNHDSFWRGDIFPLWNPLNHCGVPYLAQWQTFVLYPVWWLFLPFSPSWSLGIFMLCHLLFAGLTMYFLAHRWTGSRIGACVAGIVYTFNGMMQNSLTWPHIVAALAWAPLVILFVEEAWKTGGRKIILAALVGVLQMLTGAPEQILFTWFILLILALRDLIAVLKTRSADSLVREVVPEQNSRTRLSALRISGRFIGIAALIAALAAAQLLPFLDLIAHSQRSTGFASTEGARPGGMTWSIPGWGWANLFVPLFYNFPTPSGIYFPSSQYLTSSYYLGIATLLFCLSLALYPKSVAIDRKPILLLGIFLLGFVLALGENGYVYDLLLKIFPPLSFMRYPVKFMFLASMIAPLLVAYGVSRFLQVDDLQKNVTMRRFWFLCGTLSLIVTGILCFAKNFPLYPGMAKLWPVVLQNGGLRILSLVLIVGLFCTLHSVKTARLQVLLACSVILLFWLDLQTQAPLSPNPTVPRWTYNPGMTKIATPPRHGESRALVTLNTQLKFIGYQSPTPTNDVLFNRMILLHECNLLDRIPVVSGTHTLLLPESDRVASLLLTTNEAFFRNNIADFLGISQMSDETHLDWKPRSTFLPIATAGQKPAFADDQTTFAALANGSFNPRETVFLPPEAKSVSERAQASSIKILSANYRPSRIDLKTESDASGWVVLAQSFHHNWRAYVDGQPIKIWKANYGFQALEVPSGTHDIKVIYEDKLFLIGAIISLLALFGCVLSSIIFIRRKTFRGKRAANL